MSLFLFGLSHASAPVSVLERATVSEDERVKMVEELIATDHVAEAMIVSTCNRVEIYAAVEAFHPALEAVSGVLGEHSGLSIGEMTQYAYVRYSEAAVEHLFTVAGGLDSMVVGEQQILGQIRASYASSSGIGGVGTVLHGVAQHALRAGKRVHAETGIDKVGASVVSVALDRAQARRTTPIRSAVVLGAGAMGSLAAAYLARHGVSDIALINRTYAKAEHLAANLVKNHGLNAHAESMDDVVSVVADADVLVTCTGAVGSVVGVGDVHSALTARTVADELVICDLGLPRDVDPAAARLPGVFVVDIESLSADNSTHAAQADTDAARSIVADELAEYLAGQRQAEVTPTVTALRRRAAEVVEAEMMRLESRLPDLGDPQRDEVAKTVRRVVDKLLHAPTVRVKQLASTPQGDSYAEALRELFELKPGAAESVSAPETDLAPGRRGPGGGAS